MFATVSEKSQLRRTSAKKENFFNFQSRTAGCVCFGLVFVVERLGGVFSIGIALSGITSGTLLGLFTIGMVWRRCRFTSNQSYDGFFVSFYLDFGEVQHQGRVVGIHCIYSRSFYNRNRCSNTHL